MHSIGINAEEGDRRPIGVKQDRDIQVTMKRFTSKKRQEIHMEGLLVVIIGLVLLLSPFMKDAMIKPCAKGTDHTKAVSDVLSGRIDAKTLDKRLTDGYYVKKDK